MLYFTSDTALTEGNNGAYPTAATNLVASSPLGLPLPRCGQANHCPKQRPVRPTLGTVVGKTGYVGYAGPGDSTSTPLPTV